LIFDFCIYTIPMDFLTYLKSIDFQLFTDVQQYVGRWEWLDSVGMFAAKWLVVVIALGALATLIPRRVRVMEGGTAKLLGRRSWFFPGGALPDDQKESQTWYMDYRTALTTMIAAGGGYLVRYFAGNYFMRVRPHIRTGAAGLTGIGFDEFSFPSGHATIAFAMALSVTLQYPGLGVLLLIGGVLVAAGRVYAGVHYPSDVIAGAVLGCGSALVARFIMRKIPGYVVTKRKVVSLSQTASNPKS